MSIPAQQSEEWLKMRKNKVGASDAPVIMGVSPWKTPYQLWLEKVSSHIQDQKSEAMQRGLDLEEEARSTFEQMTGLTVIPLVVLHDEYDWMMASLDGIDIEKKAIVELKCPNKIDHQMAVSGKIPEKYFPQLQHQIAVCKVDKAYYFSYNGREGAIVQIYRDDKYIKQLIEKERHFYDCVQTFNAPEANERDYNIIDEEETCFLASKILETKKMIKNLEKQESIMMEDFMKRCEFRNTQGNNFKLTKSVRKGSVDYSSIPQLLGVDTEKYRKPTVEAWRLTNG